MNNEQQLYPTESGDVDVPRHLEDDWDSESGKYHLHHASTLSRPVFQPPLHHQQQQHRHNGLATSTIYPSDIPLHSITGAGVNMITTSSSSSSKQMNGKLGRPRRRSKRPPRSDCSITSDSSENSLISRYSSTTASSSNRLSRRGGGGSSGHLVHNHHPSANSLFGMGSAYSTTASVSSATTTTSHLHTSSSAYNSNNNVHKLGTLSTASSADYSLQSNHSFPPSPPPPLPSLRDIASEFVLICSLYCRYTIHSVRKPYQRCKRALLYTVMTIAAVVILLAAWLFLDFYSDAVQVCTPPPSHYQYSFSSDFTPFSQQQVYYDTNAGTMGGSRHHPEQDGEDEPRRPLVEYYVHGRGIGHYARSVAIVEQLNRAGIDVRMFLTRSAMWRAMHEDSHIVDIEDETDTDVDETEMTAAAIVSAVNDAATAADGGTRAPLQYSKGRGKTTAISVASLTPQQNFFEVISHVVERISGDCEVAASSGRYPELIVSDGDMPGMLRAWAGGIPSVGIAHGQLFSIAQKPSWVKSVPHLNRAWNKQGTLNFLTSFFTEWQIATHFCFLESKYASGIVAQAPLRPEVVQMVEARKWAREGRVHKRALPQGARIRKLLLPEEEEEEVTKQTRSSGQRRRHGAVNNTQTAQSKQPSQASGSSTLTSATSRRKLVICYFRDHNGEIVVQALLDAGFDVLLFDNGYFKDMADDPNRYGVKWIVQDHRQEHRTYIRGDDRRRLLQGSGTGGVKVEDGLVLNGNATATDSFRRRLSETAQVHKNTPNGPNLIRVMDRSLFVPLMHVADGVASSAGSQLMSECIYSHMPLLALYTEQDDEQRLNVELSHHVDAPCHRPLVFGTSFEQLTMGLKTNETYFATHHRLSPVLDALAFFMQEVRASPISDTFYRNAHLVDNPAANNRPDQNNTNNDTSTRRTDDQDRIISTASSHKGHISEDDPSQSLPDAGAIILEIMKQVLQKR